MSRPSLEVADIFRGHGPAWRRANAGHVSLSQLKVMSAIESCRTAALGGHVAALRELRTQPDLCTTPAATGTVRSARARRQRNGWRRARPICCRCRIITSCSRFAWSDRRYRLPEQDRHLRPAVQDLGRDPPITIADDPKHLGARIGITAVLHSWGLGHDPSPARPHDRAGRRHLVSTASAGWHPGPGFFLPVRVLSRLFRRLFLESAARRPPSA